MFYKAIRAYKLRDMENGNFSEITLDMLKEKMQEQAFQPIHPSQSLSLGWVEPSMGHACADNGEGGIYEIIEAGDSRYIDICLKTERKVMPPAAIKEAVNKRIAEIEKVEGRKVSRPEKGEIKAEIIANILPTALTVTGLIHAYIDMANGIIVIESSSSSKAEMLLNYMRKTIGSFRVIPIHAKNGFRSVIGAWYLSSNEDGFMGRVVAGSDIELTHIESKTVKAKFSGNYDRAIVEGMLKDGYMITKIGLVSETARFMLDSELAIKKLALVVDSEAEEIEDMYARWKADFILQADIFGNLLNAVMRSFMQVTEGGEEQTEMPLAGGAK